MTRTESPASYLERYLDPFRDLLRRDDVVEIAINPDGKVWLEVAGDATMRHEGQTVDRTTALNMAQTIVGDAEARVSEKNPLVSGKVEYAGRPLRVQVAVPPAIDHGASITIRLFASGSVRDYAPAYLFGKAVSLDALRAEKMKNITCLAEENLEAALQTLVEARLNVLISGGTSTGKTTFARHLLTHVSEHERLITIEDAFELFPSHANTVCMKSDRLPGSEKSPAKLLESSLRMRPDRIILGELRGFEALTFLEAINTGHGGSFTTIHADTALKAIDRLAMMVLGTGLNMSFEEVRRYCAHSIDVVIQLGREDGRRGVAEIFLPGVCAPRQQE